MRFLIFLFLFVSSHLPAQDLLLNGNFEETNSCAEYAALCAPEGWFRIPPTDLYISARKRGKPQEGEMSEMIVFENQTHPISYRVYLYTQLLCPLEAGQQYHLSLYLNSMSHADYRLGVLFSEKELIAGISNPILYEASVELDARYENEDQSNGRWKKLELTFTARGGERYLTFGNFNKQGHLFKKKDKPTNGEGDFVYLLDQVSLMPEGGSADNVPCIEYEENKKRLYNYNHRHTYKKGVSGTPLSRVPLPKVDQQKTQERPMDPPTLEMEIDTPTVFYFEIPEVAFAFDRHEIRPQYFPELDSLIHTIRSLNPLSMTITGHTDSIGTPVYNQQLSLNRAGAVRDYLCAVLPELKASTRIKGMGEQQPKVPNDSDENRAINRRVEIKLIVWESLMK